MSKYMLRLTGLVILVVLFSLPLTLALADSGGPPTPTPLPPPTATWVFPTGAPTATPTPWSYYPGSTEPNAAAPVEGQPSTGADAQALEPDYTIESQPQDGEQPSESGRSFPLWPIILVVVVGVGLVLGIIGYFVFVKRSP